MSFIGDLTGASAGDKARLDRERARRQMLGNDPASHTEWTERFGHKYGAFGNKLRADKQLAKYFGTELGGILQGIGAQGTAHKNQAYDQYQQMLGGINQQAINTGRFSTSGTDQARMGAMGQMQRNFAAIDSALAGTYSNVALQGLGTMMGLQKNIAYNSFDRQQWAAGNWWPQGSQYQHPSGGFMNILGGIGGVFSTAVGIDKAFDTFNTGPSSGGGQ